MMKTLLTALVIGALLSVAAALAPLYHMESNTAVRDEYIVVLKDELSIDMRDEHILKLSAAHPTVAFIDSYAIGTFVAFAAIMDKGALARELEHEDVKYIEANQVVRANEEEDADGTLTQSGSTWGISRIWQKAFTSKTSYKYWSSAGSGVDVYVVDTGILTAHLEFEGRAVFGANYATGGNEDCNGHGTHVAGTIGSVTYGVAKKVTLFSVKVLGCDGSGTNAGVISGVQWTVKNHQSRGRRSVANLSLGGAASSALDAAINEAIAQGITYVVAAGNDNANACTYSPARVPNAITVGATADTDARSSFSNYGTCVNIFAPGSSIKSTWIGSNTATNTISGTSMASPHVAGAVAAYLGHLITTGAATPTPAAVKEYLVNVANSGAVGNPGTGSPNKLLFSVFE